MAKINLWNSISLAQTGKVRLLDSGRELFGTVVKHGVNDKTVTVRVSSKHFNHKYRKQLYSNKNKQVHDELNYCVTGDRVIIANCNQISNTKSYYIKTIVQPFGRSITPKGQQVLEESQTLTQNPTKTVALSPLQIQQETAKILKKQENQMVKKAQVILNKGGRLKRNTSKNQNKMTKEGQQTHFKVLDTSNVKNENQKQSEKIEKKDNDGKPLKKQSKKAKQQKSLDKPKKKFINRRQKKADKLV